jgi:hypothetical protein
LESTFREITFLKPKQFKQETQSGQTKLNDTPLLIDLNCSVVKEEEE